MLVFLTFRFFHLRFLVLICLCVLKFIWFSWLVFWAEKRSRLRLVYVSETWCDFRGAPFRLVAEGKTSILLKDFDAFYKKTQFYLRNFMFLTSGSLLGSLGHPWEPLGPPSVRIVFLLSTLRALLGCLWSSSGTIFTFLLFVCHVFSFLACSFHFFSCMFSWSAWFQDVLSWHNRAG